MGKTIKYNDTHKWRNKSPNKHRRYGERRNRDLKKYILGGLDYEDQE